MGYTDQVIAGFRRLKARVGEVAVRQKNDARRLLALERRVFGVLGDPNALPAAPGSPVLQIGELFIAKITGAGSAGEYNAVRRTIDPATPFALEGAEDDESIVVRTLPITGDGDEDEHFGALAIGSHALVRWEGQDSAGTDLFYAFPMITVARMRVKSVGNDHLVCRILEGSSEGAIDILVAKPWYLRRTPYHGKSITFLGSLLTFAYASAIARTVTNSAGDSESQGIVPAYTGTGTGYLGEEILAIAGFGGGTGVTVSGQAVAWQQIPDARMWAKL